MVNAAVLLCLCDVIEGLEPVVSHTDLQRQLGDQTIQALVSDGLIEPANPAEQVVLQMSDEDVVAEVLEIRGDKAMCFDPEAGIIEVPIDPLRRWRVSLNRLSTRIAHQLGMPASFTAKPLVDGLLWDLGEPRLGKAKGRPVLLARCLNRESERQKIRAELSLRGGSAKAILLVSTRHVASDISLPTVMRVVPIGSVCTSAGIDQERLAALADAAPGQQEFTPCACAEDGTWLRWHGREFTFRGQQATLYRTLFEAWERGESWSSEQFVLMEAGYESRRIRDALKRSKVDWQALIEVEDGYCRLIPDPPWR